MSKAKGSGLREQVRGQMSVEEALSDPRPSSQDLSTLDVAKLTPLSPEVISRQATINIGARSVHAAALALALL